MSALLGTPEGAGIVPRKFVITGGEAASWEMFQRIADMKTCAIINHYGPTETTIGSLTYDFVGLNETSRLAAIVPLGRPIANSQVYVLDVLGQPAPFGVAGELCISGDGVSSGYLNQPEQTAQRFVRNPFSVEASSRMYMSGDRARWLPDGIVEFLGRVDNQVKIRGHRVEPEEIEGVLRKHASVQQAVVIPRDDKTGEKRLVAYVAPGKGAATADELRIYLSHQLPEYMVPSVIVVMPALPLTPNGKIDRRSLPDPEVNRDAGKVFVGSRNSVEQALADIWAQVLGVERVGVNDNFFELGGHSLLATQVVSRVRSDFDVQLPLRSIFEAPTVAGLAETVSGLQSVNGHDDEMGRMLAELENLSEEEVQRLLELESQQT